MYLQNGTKLCFNPEQIKAIQEVAEDRREADGGCMLYLSGFPDPFGLACSYELFLERANVNPQKIEDV